VCRLRGTSLAGSTWHCRATAAGSSFGRCRSTRGWCHTPGSVVPDSGDIICNYGPLGSGDTKRNYGPLVTGLGNGDTIRNYTLLLTGLGSCGAPPEAPKLGVVSPEPSVASPEPQRGVPRTPALPGGSSGARGLAANGR